MKKILIITFSILVFSWSSILSAAENVKIGVLYPLTGPVAQVGKDAVAAVKTALDLINNSHDIDIPLAKNKGLSGLNGAKISIVVGDHGGKPDIGVAETEKMLNSDKVHAMFGAYYSSVTGAASQVSERAGIPWVNGESTSPKLTKRGFKYFFRVTPHDGEFTQLMFEFMNDFNKKNNGALKTVGILHEDTLWGSDSGSTQNKMAKKQKYKVIEKIAYKAKTTTLDSEVQRLKAKNPDVLLPSSYTSDAYLFLNTASKLNYSPKLLVAQNAGYTDPKFIATMGSKAEGVITRSPFNTDLAKTIPLIGDVNRLFKKHSGGRDLSDVPARAFTGFMALAQAINVAGSTDPKAIQTALQNIDIGPETLIVPYRGVKFGKDGQNTKTRGILMQVQNGKYCTVYPFELAACKLQYPMPAIK
jgi:branched-chain amino acid transport system substrate-binding protein|tara:strand:- start:845 stop:2092 length:1248 start_codon:yes stop_codon:yes gene_type:complete